MKKQVAMLAVATLCITSLASCGSKKSYDYDYSEYLTLGEYKGIAVSASELDTEVQGQMETLLTENAYQQDTGAAAEDGNILTYSYTGTIDGTAVDALSKTDVTFTLGSGTIGLDELDEAAFGMSAGETKEITLTIPEDFANDEAVDGKEAVITFTVSKVEETLIPTEVTDEMVSDTTDGAYTDVASYTAYVRSSAKQSLVWDAVVANTVFLGYPEDEAETYYNNMVSSYTQSATQYGMTLDSLISAYGYTTDQFYNELANEAVAQTQKDMLMFAIAEKENLVPDQTKLDEVAAELADYYGYEDVATMKETVTDEAIEMSAKYELVMDFLEANAVEN